MMVICYPLSVIGYPPGAWGIARGVKCKEDRYLLAPLAQ